jgi:hypothetical protein
MGYQGGVYKWNGTSLAVNTDGKGSEPVIF